MVLQDLENVYTDVLPGLSLPAGAAWFVLARVEWIRKGEVAAFDLEAPSPWQFSDLCTLAFFVANHETGAYIKKRPFRRRKQTRGQCASSGLEIDVELQVMISFRCIYRVFFLSGAHLKNTSFFWQVNSDT